MDTLTNLLFQAVIGLIIDTAFPISTPVESYTVVQHIDKELIYGNLGYTGFA
jgi:hypothetical protein